MKRFEVVRGVFGNQSPIDFLPPPPSLLCPNLNFSKHPCMYSYLVMANPPLPPKFSFLITPFWKLLPLIFPTWLSIYLSQKSQYLQNFFSKKKNSTQCIILFFLYFSQIKIIIFFFNLYSKTCSVLNFRIFFCNVKYSQNLEFTGRS